jgi:hypothetical protein
VPLAVDACRCGAARPAGTEPAGSSLEVATDSNPVLAITEEAPRLLRGARQLGMLLLVVGVYFGSRGCNRWLTSRETRKASMEALSDAVGKEGAEALLDRHHDACFDETYQTGWGRRQSSKFDEAKYVKCVLRGVEKDALDPVRESRARAPVAVASQPPTAAPKVTPPTPTPTPEPDYGLLTIGDFKVTVFKSEPNVQLVFAYVVVGNPEALKRAKSCMVDVRCGGQRIPGYNEPTFTECDLALDGFRGKGSKAISWINTTPVQGACTLLFAVVRASRLQSNEILVDLQETSGR